MEILRTVLVGLLVVLLGTLPLWEAPSSHSLYKCKICYAYPTKDISFNAFADIKSTLQMPAEGRWSAKGKLLLGASTLAMLVVFLVYISLWKSHKKKGREGVTLRKFRTPVVQHIHLPGINRSKTSKKQAPVRLHLEVYTKDDFLEASFKDVKVSGELMLCASSEHVKVRHLGLTGSALNLASLPKNTAVITTAIRDLGTHVFQFAILTSYAQLKLFHFDQSQGKVGPTKTIHLRNPSSTKMSSPDAQLVYGSSNKLFAVLWNTETNTQCMYEIDPGSGNKKELPIQAKSLSPCSLAYIPNDATGDDMDKVPAQGGRFLAVQRDAAQEKSLQKDACVHVYLYGEISGQWQCTKQNILCVSSLQAVKLDTVGNIFICCQERIMKGNALAMLYGAGPLFSQACFAEQPQYAKVYISVNSLCVLSNGKRVMCLMSDGCLGMWEPEENINSTIHTFKLEPTRRTIMSSLKIHQLLLNNTSPDQVILVCSDRNASPSFLIYFNL